MGMTVAKPEERMQVTKKVVDYQFSKGKKEDAGKFMEAAIALGVTDVKFDSKEAQDLFDKKKKEFEEKKGK
jgi:hypothetical protein